MTSRKTARQLQLQRASSKLRIRAKIETNKDIVKRKQLENQKLRAELRTI